jgi:hypothetical protein
VALMGRVGLARGSSGFLGAGADGFGTVGRLCRAPDCARANLLAREVVR